MDQSRWLLIETSGRIGLVGIGDGHSFRAERQLDESRRHARDLAPAAAELLRSAGWTARSLSGIGVSVGPGSYTGLRVGIMTAKTLAYATGCALVGVPTFELIARQADVGAAQLDVLADALKDKLYAQRFVRADGNEPWRAAADLAIVRRTEWLSRWTQDVALSGPGVDLIADSLPGGALVASRAARVPGLGALQALAVSRPTCEPRAAAFALEPIYLRPSSAEEQISARAST